MNTFETSPELFAVFAVMALHLCAVYTGLGAFPLAWFSEARSAAKGKVFFKKLSQQLSALGLMFLAYTLVAAGGSFAVIHTKAPELIRPWMEQPALMVPMLVALGVFVVLALAYAFTWRSASRMPAVHRLLGFLTTLGVVGVLGMSLCMKLALYADLPGPARPVDICTLLGAGMGHPLLAPLLINTIFATLACGAGFGLIYLLTRRKRDDFGRDYYGFAARSLANSAIVGTLGTLATQAWVASGILTTLVAGSRPTLLGWLTIAGGCGALVAMILWAVVARSQQPMRAKPAMLVAALGLLVAVGGFAAVNASLFLPL